MGGKKIDRERERERERKRERERGRENVKGERMRKKRKEICPKIFLSTCQAKRSSLKTKKKFENKILLRFN